MTDKKIKIILDTNFLLLPGQYKIDIFSEIENLLNHDFELFIVDKTIDELNMLKIKEKAPDRMAANIGLQLIEKKGVKKIKTKDDEKIVDDHIIELVKKENYLIATIDKGLKNKLLSLGKAIIEVKQKKNLKITQN